MAGKLNVDIAGAITELESLMQEFKLKRDVYRVLFRGKGLEFEDYRTFTPDDDARDIDWKSSARAQKLLVKRYKEERDLKIIFVVDVGSNMVFGSADKIKCEYVVELVSALANLMLSFDDAIGLILFSEKVTHFIECKKGKKQFQIFVDLLSDGNSYGGKTQIDSALDFATDFLDNSISSVILISDLLSVTADTKKKLGLLSSRFETIIIRIRDVLDMTLPNIGGEIILESSSTHDQIMINPGVAKKAYEKIVLEKDKIIENMVKDISLDYLDLITDKPFALPLAVFLKERVARKF